MAQSFLCRSSLIGGHNKPLFGHGYQTLYLRFYLSLSKQLINVFNFCTTLGNIWTKTSPLLRSVERTTGAELMEWDSSSDLSGDEKGSLLNDGGPFPFLVNSLLQPSDYLCQFGLRDGHRLSSWRGPRPKLVSTDIQNTCLVNFRLYTKENWSFTASKLWHIRLISRR